MRIRYFGLNISQNELQQHELKNCDLVIDAQNLFYGMYQRSGLPFQFGCESNKYAEYLREQLSVFKKANVNCYFIFKGGHNDIQRRLEKRQGCQNYENSILETDELNAIVLPVFMKEVYKQVLDEMNFKYSICELESKKQCIALAQILKCPVLSYDIEFCFAGVQYIPYPKDASLIYDETTGAIPCGLFVFDDFVQKYNLNKEKLAIFIILTDEHIFSENYFQTIFRAINIVNCNLFNRNRFLLRWLSKPYNVNRFPNILQECLRADDINTFTRKKNEVMELICRQEVPEIPVDYLMHNCHVDFDNRDPFWLKKGVASGYVSLQYVNVYRYGIITGSWSIEDRDAEDAMFLSIDVIKYAYNLMTDYKKTELEFHNKNLEIVRVNIADANSIPKPTYTAVQSPFENGWTEIKSLRLFEHFLENSMPASNFSKLNALPEDARLLMIALVYFSQQKPVDTTVEVCSVLLSYLMLGVVQDTADGNANHIINLDRRPILDSITDKEQITVLDSNTAATIMSQYFTLSQTELRAIFDRQILHPLVEFQHCLQQMNFLNKLCGSPYKPTMYSHTYNGTFVYKITHTIRTDFAGVAMDFIENKLSPAPTVLAFFNGLKETYDEIMYQ